MAGPRTARTDSDSRRALAGVLTEGGCQVVAALRAPMTIAYACRMQRPTVVVTELDLRPAGSWGGLQLLATLAKEHPQVPVLVVTRPELMVELADRAIGAGVHATLAKPVRPEELVGTVHRLHKLHKRFLATCPSKEADGGDARRPR